MLGSMAAVFDDHTFGYWRCDNCGRTLSSVAGVKPVLPRPWQSVEIDGFIGDFHVCTMRCLNELTLVLGNARKTDPD
jgi:hypothetical protein